MTTYCGEERKGSIQIFSDLADQKSGIVKRAGCILSVIHLLEDGYDIRTIQVLTRHKDVNARMIDTHVLNKGGKGVRNLLDR